MRMTAIDKILACFSDGPAGRPLYLPDLTLWYDYHLGRGTLPEPWQGSTLPQIARELHVPIWAVAQPLRDHAPSVSVVTTEHDNERVIRAESAAGVITARWIVGPDGAMWQTEYPVKHVSDLAVVLDLAEARRYHADPTMHELLVDVGDDGVVALEIPRRPLSDLLHEYLGWGEGLFLLAEAKAKVAEIVDVLDAKLRDFVAEVAQLPGSIVYSPDNLDGQFISPRLFQEYLADSYRRTADTLHAQDKQLVVHIGGPIRHLVGPLVEAGIDGLEGVCAAPQSDLSLADARVVAGSAVTLWGGIAQDFLLSTTEIGLFEEAVRQAVHSAGGDGRMILGVADRVPVDAELDRLTALPALVEQALTHSA